MIDRFFEDFTVGDTFETGTMAVNEDDIVDFARRFDPQPWHLDAHIASTSPFKGLVASGWHTAAITMRLFVDSGVMRATGILGIGVDELRWLKPLRPGTTVHVRAEVKSLEPPAPDRHAGTMRVHLSTIDQAGETVQTEVAILRVRIRPH
ncbi:MAG TPA: MaoC family dehydratase [Candidatus Eremiobacteraceae bacterium]|nr:MaoC family dehydratase [Candidatus Eremiobacteraceae bacterium]